jgi:hypothetical protein
MKHLIFAALLSLTLATSASAERYNPYSPEDPGYADAMRNYGKEMLFAKYAARQCTDYKVTYNGDHFEQGPPLLWDNTRYQNFLTVVMVETKEKLDKQLAAKGHDAFCQTAIEFFAANYKPGKKPVFINGM